MTDDSGKKAVEYEIGYGKPPVETRFQPGNVPVSPGRPKELFVATKYRKLTQHELMVIGQAVIDGDIPALEEIVKNAKAADPERRPTVLQVFIASCFLKAIKKGDVDALNKLLDRFVGRVPVAINLNAKAVIGVQNLSDQEAIDETLRITQDLDAHFRVIEPKP